MCEQYYGQGPYWSVADHPAKCGAYLTGWDRIGTDERNNDRSSGGRGLEEDSCEDTNHESSDWVGVIRKQRTGSTPSDDLRRGPKEIETEEEEVEEEEQENDSDEDHPPFLWRMATAGGKYLAPCSITDVCNVLLKEVHVSDMC